MTMNAWHAVRAAHCKKCWGRWYGRLYIETHGVPFGLYRLACQLEAAK